MRGAPFQAVGSHIADHSQFGYRRNIASVTHWIDLVQGLVWPLRHVARGLAWLPQLRGESTSIARTKIGSRCLVTIRYRPGKRCHPSQCVWCRNATWSTFSIFARRFLPLMTPLEKATGGPSLDPLGGAQRSAWLGPARVTGLTRGQYRRPALRTVAANRRFAKLYLSPIRAVPARGLVDAIVGGSTVQSVLRCHRLCEIWHAGAYFGSSLAELQTEKDSVAVG